MVRFILYSPLTTYRLTHLVLFPGFQFVDNIFDSKHDHLASIYKPWNRVLLVTDTNVNGLYSEKWNAYFAYHGIPLTMFIMNGGEKNKTMETMLSIVDAMTSFGIIRKEVRHCPSLGRAFP